MIAADILQVRQGKNYLITDFTRTEGLRDDPTVMSILSRVSREIGFDFVRDHEQAGDRYHILPNVPFEEWANPYFEAGTPGRIAAQYCELLHQCYPIPRDDALRGGQIAQVVQYIRTEGKSGVEQLSLAVAGLGASFPDNAAVQKLAPALIKELARYKESGREDAPRQKAEQKKTRER